MSLENLQVHNAGSFHNLFIVDSITNEEYEGDVNILTVRGKPKLVEENNNEIDILTKNFEEMGNITNKFKRNDSTRDKYKTFAMEIENMDEAFPDHAYGDNKETHRVEQPGKKKGKVEKQDSTEYEYNSDDFEDDFEDDEDILEKPDEQSPKRNANASSGSNTAKRTTAVCRKSDFIDDLHIKGTIGARSQRSSCSGGDDRRSQRNLFKEDYDRVSYLVRAPSRNTCLSTVPSMPGPQTRRINMSFTNARSREIERENHILLKKILRSRCAKPGPGAVSAPPGPRPPASCIARRRGEQRIEHENLILLRKIQRAKPSNLSIRK